MRFYFHSDPFKASFTHPTESLFVPAFAVSFGTILTNIVEYGFGKVGNWLDEAVVVFFLVRPGFGNCPVGWNISHLVRR